MAKQAATIQGLSGGRLVLGGAVGGRPNDFEAGGAPFEGRGRRMDEMLDQMSGSGPVRVEATPAR